MSAMSQSYMHGSTIFDGARAYNNLVPDLHLHCERLFNSAKVMGLEVPIKIDELISLCKKGIAKFEARAELYIRPSIFCNSAFLIPEKKSSNLVLTIFRAPMPSLNGFTAMLSSYRRPNPLMAPTLAKASCLYANTSLALSEAKTNGFDNVVMRDGEENIVEFGSANLFMVKSDKVITPKWNKTFLNGITKQRVISLLKEEGIENTDLFLALTDSDEVNVIVSILAKRLGAHKTIALVKRDVYANLAEQSGDVDIIVSPDQITVSGILSHLRKGDFMQVHSLQHGKSEAIEIVVHGNEKTSKVVGVCVRDLPLPEGVVVGAIVRDEELLMGSKKLVIQSGDHVLMVLMDVGKIHEVEALFLENES